MVTPIGTVEVLGEDLANPGGWCYAQQVEYMHISKGAPEVYDNMYKARAQRRRVTSE